MSQQITCGELKPYSFVHQDKSTAKCFRGPVRLRNRLDGELIFEPHKDAKKSDNHPDWAVKFKEKSGVEYDMGSAWLKNGRQGDFLSITLTDPDWPADVSLAAFPIDGGAGTFRLVWSRPRERQDAQSS
jgi:uncharacterized protein (DUF736 family)